ncbi:MAG: hypothetical protein H8E15_02350 [Planctomycetes bacterium]|nr:hypothetical protein [Planctomycetota bacterium]
MSAASAVPSPVVTLPGCKSLSQRALILAASGVGPCRLIGLSDCDDSRFLCQALRGLGVNIEPHADAYPEAVTVHGLGGPPTGNGEVVDVGEAGSSLRFLLPWCAAGSGEFVLTGAPRLFERPHDGLIDFLTTLGAKIQVTTIGGRPGLKIEASNLQNSPTAGANQPTIWLPPALKSSQFLSGILMASAWSGPLEIHVPTSLPSRGYFDLTLQAMQEFGWTIKRQSDAAGNLRLHISAAACQRRNPAKWQVPGDPSGATFFLVALALQGGRMRLGPDWSATHPEAQMLRWFVECGLLIQDGELWRCTNQEPHDAQLAIDFAPDAGPALAVLGAFLPGGMTLHGIARLRIKESDRVAGIQRLLQCLGSNADVVGDSLRIAPIRPMVTDSADPAASGAFTTPAAAAEPEPNFHPDGDHRLAMAAGIARLRYPELQIQQQQCVAKSFPDFWQQLTVLE